MQQVIYAWNYLEWGGAQIHILALIKEVRKEFDVIVLLPSGSDDQINKYITELGVEHRSFDAHLDLGPADSVRSKIRRRISKIRSEYEMLKKIREVSKPGATVHIDLLPHQSLGPLIWLALRGPVFITSHNRLPKVAKWRESLWKIKCSVIARFRNFHVFCSNNDSKAYFSEHYPASMEDRISVTYTSVNPTEIEEARNSVKDRGTVRRNLGINDSETVVLAVGNFIDRKGRWTLLDAAKRVSATIPSIRFVWLTPQLPSDADKSRVDGYGLQGTFQIVKSKSVGEERMDILKFFLIADIFALPSFVEGLPIALLEAMALGLPSISTNVNAIPEAVKPLETGILIEPGDADALASSIIQLAGDADLRERLSVKGREFVIEHFDEQKVARFVSKAYQNALSNQ